MNGYFRRSGQFLFALVIAGLFCRFIPDKKSGGIEFKVREAKKDPVFLLSPAAWVDSVLQSLTPEQRIAQMIMVAAYSNNNPSNEQEVEMLVRDYGVGGLVFFQGSPVRQVQLTNYYQSIAKNTSAGRHGCRVGSWACGLTVPFVIPGK